MDQPINQPMDQSNQQIDESFFDCEPLMFPDIGFIHIDVVTDKNFAISNAELDSILSDVAKRKIISMIFNYRNPNYSNDIYRFNNVNFVAFVITLEKIHYFNIDVFINKWRKCVLDLITLNEKYLTYHLKQPISNIQKFGNNLVIYKKMYNGEIVTGFVTYSKFIQM